MINRLHPKIHYGWFILLAICLQLSCRKNNYPDDPFVYKHIQPGNLPAPPARLGLDPFYKKYVDAGGIPVISSEYTQDEALLKAAQTILTMMAYLSDSVKAQMIQLKTRVGIISQYEKTKDMPEYRFLPDSINDRARGLGAYVGQPLCSTAEENVLCLHTTVDKWGFMDVLTHEFAHAIHLMGLLGEHKDFDAQLQKTFNDARASGLWDETYAATNYREYWAEGVGLWFNCNKLALKRNATAYPATREGLKMYDPQLYELVSAYFTPADVKNGCY